MDWLVVVSCCEGDVVLMVEADVSETTEKVNTTRECSGVAEGTCAAAHMCEKVWILQAGKPQRRYPKMEKCVERIARAVADEEQIAGPNLSAKEESE